MTTQSTPDTASLTRRNLLVIGVAAAAAACGADPASGGDASMATDTSMPGDTSSDTGPADTSPSDSGQGDTGAPDVSPTDAGSDTGPADASSPDASTDASSPDAATDASSPDAATDASADVSRPDASTDATSPDATPADVATDTGPACPPAGATMLGAVTSFPVGSWRNVKAARVIVGRDARGIFAYTSVCTHSGCTVPAPSAATSGSTCPCHGSQYNNDGMVTRGPAPRSLDNREVVVCGGDVYVTSNTVPVGTRAPVT